MKKIGINAFLSRLDYKPKHVGEELCDPVRFVEFRTAGCHSPSLEFGTKVNEEKGGQYFYFEVIDFRNYDTAKGDIISDDRRHGVISAYLNEKNADSIAEAVNVALRNVYRRKGPAW